MDRTRVARRMDSEPPESMRSPSSAAGRRDVTRSNADADASYYTITKTGVQAGGALAGTEVWKDKDLN